MWSQKEGRERQGGGEERKERGREDDRREERRERSVSLFLVERFVRQPLTKHGRQKVFLSNRHRFLRGTQKTLVLLICLFEVPFKIKSGATEECTIKWV